MYNVYMDQSSSSLQTQTCICSTCKMQTYALYYFCPNCGKPLRHKPLSTSFFRQAGIYLFCVFFPPFGLWPAYKYFHEQSGNAKAIAAAATILTIASLIVTTYYTLYAMTFVQKYMENQGVGLSASYPF